MTRCTSHGQGCKLATARGTRTLMNRYSQPSQPPARNNTDHDGHCPECTRAPRDDDCTQGEQAIMVNYSATHE
jgi:hypothetical protein